MECKVIMANVRQYAGGAYLKAVTKKGHERKARISVEFTGNAYEETSGNLNICDIRVRRQVNARVSLVCLFVCFFVHI